MGAARKRRAKGRATPHVPETARHDVRLWVGLAVLVLVLVIGTWARVVQATNVELLDADATIAYLQSAGHAGEDWRQATVGSERLTGRWVPASQWKALLKAEFPPPFARIWRDQATNDVHPPLYYVGLGIWRVWLGQGMKTGIVLNVPIAVLSILTLFAFALMVTEDYLDASIVAGFFALMPAALAGVTTAVKMYELLILLTILHAVLVLAYIRSEGRRSHLIAVGIAVVSGLGILTHSLFALSMLLGAAWMVAALTLPRRPEIPVRRIAIGLGSIAIGYAWAAVVYPPLLAAPGKVVQLGDGHTGAVTAATEDVAVRIEWLRRLLVDGLLGVQTALSSLRLAWLWIAIGAIIAIAAAAILYVLRKPSGSSRQVGAKSKPARSAPSLGLALAVASYAVAPLVVMAWGFLTFRMPYLAPRYVAQAMPFVAFTPVLLFRWLPHRFRSLPGAAYVALLGIAALLYCLPGGAPAPNVLPSAELADATSVVVDTDDMSYLTKVVILLPDETMVFATKDQKELEAVREEWQPEVGPGAHYVCFPIRGNTYDAGTAIATTMGGSRGADSLYLAPTFIGADTAMLWVMR